MDAHVKYVTYQCSVCQRQIEIQLDGRRPDPIRCIITQNCRGKLSRVSIKSTKQFLFTPIVPNLQDYVPRGTVISSSTSVVSQPPITIFTSSNDILVIAAVQRTINVSTSDAEFQVTSKDGSSFTISKNAFLAGSNPAIYPTAGYLILSLYEITSQILSYKKYIYNVSGAVQEVQGADDSLSKLTLSFTKDNSIKAFVNGKEIIEITTSEEAPGFIRSISSQKITFFPTIYETNNIVEILVYDSVDLKAAASTNIANVIELRFDPLIDQDTSRAKSCWGDYSGVTIDDATRLNLFCTNTSELLLPSKTYGVLSLKAYQMFYDNGILITLANGDLPSIEVDPSTFFILLGKEPFAFQDKELFAYVKGSNLIPASSSIQGATLLYNQSVGTGDIQLSIDDLEVTQVLTPIIPYNFLKDVVPASTTQSSTAQGTESLKKIYIKGPS